jgi:16S rRNA processing protein RimM
MTQSDWAILARLVRPQGRHGEIIADLLTDFPERFANRKHLYLLSSENSPVPVREAALEDYWLHKGRVVLKFAGVNSIGDAEVLRGLLAAIPATERALLADDSIYYVGDLIGCEVIDVASSPDVIGRVKDLDREAGLLMVERPNGDAILIPFVKDYLVSIGTSTKRIEMRLPEGLLDINAPITDEERRELDTGGEDTRS